MVLKNSLILFFIIDVIGTLIFSRLLIWAFLYVKGEILDIVNIGGFVTILHIILMTLQFISLLFLQSMLSKLRRIVTIIYLGSATLFYGTNLYLYIKGGGIINFLFGFVSASLLCLFSIFLLLFFTNRDAKPMDITRGHRK